MKHGKGDWRKVVNNPKCNRFEGEYQFDKKNGLGTFTWESGNVYTGNYINDERVGYGEMYWTDGSIYKGEWKKGIQHGRGVMTFPDGRVKDGYFENNVFKGNTQILASDSVSNSMNTSDIRLDRSQREVRVKTRGKSNSVNRQLNENNHYNVNVQEEMN